MSGSRYINSTLGIEFESRSRTVSVMSEVLEFHKKLIVPEKFSDNIQELLTHLLVMLANV